MPVWVCAKCKAEIDARCRPAACPKCKAPKESFTKKAQPLRRCETDHEARSCRLVGKNPKFRRPGGASYWPRMPVLRSALGGVSPTQQRSTASANSLPETVPALIPRTSTVTPVPGT